MDLQHAIITILAEAPKREREVITAIGGDPAAASLAFTLAVECQLVRPLGLQWTLSAAGQALAKGMGIEVREVVPEPVTVPLRIARPKPIAAPRPKAAKPPKPPRAPRPKAVKPPKAPPELSQTRDAIRGRDYRRRIAEAKAAGVPFVPQASRFQPSDNPSPYALYQRELRARKRAAEEAGVPFVPKVRQCKGGRPKTDAPAPSTVQWRDYTARARAAEETGQPMQRRRTGPKPRAAQVG